MLETNIENIGNPDVTSGTSSFAQIETRCALTDSGQAYLSSPVFCVFTHNTVFTASEWLITWKENSAFFTVGTLLQVLHNYQWREENP